MARTYSEIERDVMGECISCAGGVKIGDGTAECAKTPPVACVLIALLKAHRGGNEAEQERLAELATPDWIAGHRESEEVLSASSKPETEVVASA